MDLKNPDKEQRTERHIKDAYLSLMAEKPYARIKVTEIIARADVARSTFYQHFEDGFAVLDSIEEKLLALLVVYHSYAEAPNDSLVGHPVESVSHWFALCQEHRHVLIALTGINGDPYFENHLRHKVARELEAMMDDDNTPNDHLRPYFVNMLANAYVGIMLFWIKDDDSRRLTPDELARIVNFTRTAYYKLFSDAIRKSDELIFGDVEVDDRELTPRQ
jgi:AcrR family transcriptional regulator